MNLIVLDTNVFISALIKEGITREIITTLKVNFLFPEFEFEEIHNHKEEIIKKSKISEKEFYILILRLLNYVRVIPTEIILPYRKQASKIIGHIDKDDVIFIATALAFNCPIWTDDVHFKKQRKIKILTTPEIIDYLK
jgi:predicted nucleic acid-binding protein